MSASSGCKIRGIKKKFLYGKCSVYIEWDYISLKENHIPGHYLLKGTVSVISSDLSIKEGHHRITTVPFKPLAEHQGQRTPYVCLLLFVRDCMISTRMTSHLFMENLEHSLYNAVFKNSNVNMTLLESKYQYSLNIKQLLVQCWTFLCVFV